MSVVLNAFKVKAFELEPIFEEWKDAPRFTGNVKKDLPVDDWLKSIKAGCIAYKVPRDYWHKVGQHYLTGQAKSRFEEVRLVMKNMHGGRYHWTWKNFKVAMRAIGGDIDTQKTEAIKVESKPSGLWWIVGRSSNDSKEAAAAPAPPVPARPVPKTRHTIDMGKALPAIPKPRRSSTASSIDSISSSGSSSVASSIGSFFSSQKSTPASSVPTSVVASPASTPGGTVTNVTNVPVWLVNACTSLEFLTNEHPKVMTAISAVLITVGSLPAIPAISAGAGGAFLASSTAHALGSLAVGLGTLLQQQTDKSTTTASGEENKQRA